VVQYRSSQLTTTSDQLPGDNPTLPHGLVYADCQLVRISHQRHAEQHGLQGELLKPTFVRKLRVAQSELLKALGFFVNKGSCAKLLGEPPELPECGGSLQQVDEMGPYSSFREKAERSTCVRALLDSKHLDFHE
jgi:hypothetical protein